MRNKKLKLLLIIVLLGLTTINVSCNKSKKINSNNIVLKEDKLHKKEFKEKVKILKVEDITNMFSSDKYGFVFEKIELDNEEIHYIGKSKDPECFGLLDVSGKDKLIFLKYSMAISDNEKINNNSFEKMKDLIEIICPSFKDINVWLNEGKNNIKSSKGVNINEVMYNGMNIKFYEDEKTGAWVLSIIENKK